jgi:aspyridone synthetase (hybrid polyketide synthase/nonribosomal peptide synthetase)
MRHDSEQQVVDFTYRIRSLTVRLGCGLGDFIIIPYTLFHAMPSTQTSIQEPIAVVGSACRFPGGSTSPSKLWKLLSQPRDVLQTFDPKRLNLNRFYHQNGDSHGSTDVQNKSYLLQEDSRVFDASFFSISPAEAEGMDPQQRILLETVFEVFEAAGCTLDQMQGSSTSVHVGVMNGDYFDIQLRDSETIPKYNATGTARSILSNRISYVFDLKGPSVTIDTACSSSLVALHQAVQSLQQGDCSAAIVGGVNLIFDVSMYIMESKMHMLSPDSRSRMWDQSANGYARGEGVAALMLKPLSHALRDGDHIEGLMRGTGVNSNGQSSGITMPNAVAQASLIRQTYQRAGLDPVRDRCQYFECHGTGTPAGDPVEARAISEALFDEAPSSDATDPLYVGSIKTVIGHTEGCAGLAGVMKVLVAIKHRTIPPNLLFENLNPAILPYYGKIQIPTEALPWPQIPTGSPLRASVNSFGFGGTNAHTIIESYDSNFSSSIDEIVQPDQEKQFIGPLIFSARSESSLLGSVRAFWQHILENPSLDLENLAWVLQQRRTAHRVKINFTGESRARLLENMEQFLLNHEKDPKLEVGIQPHPINPTEIPGVLGIFTGQGAQYPAMGRGLIQTSPLFRKTIDKCEAVLSGLADGPEWSLRKELSADAPESRLSKAELSQPLCTAVQIALVDLLHASGIQFDAVVGHSSGEIAAAYACGILTLTGAMQIAYYRGLHARLARGSEGQVGGMIAVGIPFAQALEFCRRVDFHGRLGVAASNAPQTVTLSGDLDAVEEAKQHFDKQGIFSRQLRVDTAYHSHHMHHCAEPYLRSLLACNIEVRRPRENCVWSSSVRGDTQLLKGDLSSLKGPYWVDNMVQTVLFSQAVESSIWHGGPWDVAIEVGPHPALKGPTLQTITAACGSAPDYSGVLRRDQSDVETLSGALGFHWSHLGPAFVDFNGYRGTFHGNESLPLPPMLKDLPSYCWNHSTVHWRESRISRRFRTSSDHYHELLGRRMLDDTEHELRWRNILKCNELSWARGHDVLGQVLLPGAAYVSMAFEAGKQMAEGRSIRLLEVQEVDIRRPVVVPDSKDGTETIFVARLMDSTDDSLLEAQFSFFSCPDSSSGSMLHTCSGRVLVHLGSASVDELPHREPVPSNLLDVNIDRIYSAFGGIGLNYQGIFKGLSNVQRSLNYATSTAVWSGSDLNQDYLLHPALLDVVFQSLFVARAHPSTEQMPNALLPVHIKRVLVNPNVPLTETEGTVMANMDSFVVDKTPSSLLGDMHVYNAFSGVAAVQVEGLQLKSIAEPTESQDRQIFSETVWLADASLNMVVPKRDSTNDAAEMNLAEAIDRVALYYVQRLLEEVGPDERAGLSWYHQRMCEAFEFHLALVKKGTHPVARREWLTDGPETVKALDEKYPNQIDLQLIQAIGNRLVSVLRGETQLLEVMLQENMLSRFYTEGCGFMVANEGIRSTLQQITHKFPRTSILEIGAGTGATVCLFFFDAGKFNFDLLTECRRSVFSTPSEMHMTPTHTRISLQDSLKMRLKDFLSTVRRWSSRRWTLRSL